VGNRAIPNLANRRLCRALKRMRSRARLTQVEAAALLYISDKKLSRIETNQLPDMHLLKAMMDVYHLTVNEWEPFVELWHRAGEIGWWRGYGANNSEVAALEHDADLVETFQPLVVPALLQTEDYMRLLLTNGRNPHSNEWVDRQATIRLLRQNRLVQDPVLRLHAVVDEACLHRKFPRKVMLAQLKQILGRSKLPNVTIQVVRNSGYYIGMMGSLVVLSYPDPEEAGIAIVENMTGSGQMDDPEKVRDCRLDFEHIAKMALSPEESQAFIEQVIAEL
jgi:transcriptional regulator with XRE-family HTH domain